MRRILLLVWLMFIALDCGVYFSVPKPVRLGNRWAVIPGGGFVLASEYYFGNKPIDSVQGAK